MRLLNLGCGQKFHKDWINIDFVSTSEFVKEHNLLNGIPIKNNSIDVVYHSHVLEHFSKEDGYHFIRECFRVLNKNGIIRIAVPDLEIIVKEYLKNLQLAIEEDKDAIDNYEWIKLELFDQMVRNKSGGSMISYLSNPNLENEKYVNQRWGHEAKILRRNLLQKDIKNIENKNPINFQHGFLKKFKRRLKRKVIKLLGFKEEKLSLEDRHALQIGKFRRSGEIHQWMYDRYSLKKLLLEVGFSEVRIVDGYSSIIPHWEKYQLDLINGEVRKPDSLFMEAKKL